MSDFYNPSREWCEGRGREEERGRQLAYLANTAEIYATSQTFTLKPAGNPIKAAGASALAAPGVLIGAGAVLAVAAGAMF